jgi:hypothetical protein
MFAYKGTAYDSVQPILAKQRATAAVFAESLTPFPTQIRNKNLRFGTTVTGVSYTRSAASTLSGMDPRWRESRGVNDAYIKAIELTYMNSIRVLESVIRAKRVWVDVEWVFVNPQYNHHSPTDSWDTLIVEENPMTGVQRWIYSSVEKGEVIIQFDYANQDDLTRMNEFVEALVRVIETH